ncbi:LytR/AlgR family response regulator transcription factor [Zunongwangia endophytica]|uniref:LytR/AlgR family response regulator transcription factor n=1 Tax=Zunongwangia endophytica TaxID=1808945 RepID=A0ABV8H7I5_9FLAO|nr:LytTR family DNA-binding domain-containing protein [Zunongwangia endophytica]MDN3593725.1 LytTR family DNA-binding domain-containing protein [Zunongwangia endophytica]
MRCVIVDDEESQVLICKMLVLEHKELQLAGTFNSALTALKFINEAKNIDLIFLDIMLPDIDGFELLSIMQHSSQVILMSSAKEFAIKAFEFDPVLDYLLKPIERERFNKAVQKAIGKNRTASKVPSNSKGSFYVQSEKRLIKVVPSEITFLEANGNYVCIHLEKQKILTYTSLKKVFEKLPSENFVQTHRSFIINSDKIEDIADNSVLINKKIIPISRRFRKNVLNLIDVL